MPVVVNQIATVLTNRLENSLGTGGVTSLILPDARGYSPTHGNVIFNYGGNVRNEEYDVPGSPFREGRSQTFLLELVTHDDANTEQLAYRAFEMYGSVVESIKNATDWYTMNGLAVNSEVRDLELPASGEHYRVPVIVHYRTPERDLSTAG